MIRFYLLVLLVACLNRTNAQTTIVVNSKANIFGAGKLVPPSPGGGGGGELPAELPLDSCIGFVVFPSIIGNVSCCNGGASFNPPDGGAFASSSTNIQSFGGISGIIHNGKTMFLVGVFLNNTSPVAPAPSRLDFTNNANFNDLNPEINQTFFIGDGRTGAGTGALQKYYVPQGATRLFLGFADGLEFDNQPGYYVDNVGQLVVEIETNESSALEITDIYSTNTTCGVDNGLIFVTATGGCGEIAYSIDGTNFQLSNNFENLPPGNYTVYVQDNHSGQDTQMVSIDPSGLPSATFADAVSTSCGQSNGTILVDAGPGNFEYSINGNNYQPDNEFLNLAPGDYTVFVKDENGCLSTNNVQIASSPAISIRSIEGFQADCGESDGGFSVDYEGGTGLAQLALNGGSYQNNFSFNNLPGGEYHLQLKDEAQCVIDTVYNLTQDDCPMYIPNAFTPNKDGINDQFKIYPHPDFNGEFTSFRVFDRWGGIVFYAQNFNPSDVGWNGTHRGKELGTGVYIYFIEYRSESGSPEIRRGDLTLVK